MDTSPFQRTVGVVVVISLQDIDYSGLSSHERIQLAHDLLDSVLLQADIEPFTPEQIAEIDRRVAEADAGLVVGEPYEVVLDRLRRR